MENIWDVGVALEPMENHKGNKQNAWEPIENVLKTHILRGNLLKRKGKHWFCVGTYGKRKGNICCFGTYGKH